MLAVNMHTWFAISLAVWMTLLFIGICSKNTRKSSQELMFNKCNVFIVSALLLVFLLFLIAVYRDFMTMRYINPHLI